MERYRISMIDSMASSQNTTFGFFRCTPPYQSNILWISFYLIFPSVRSKRWSSRIPNPDTGRLSWQPTLRRGKNCFGGSELAVQSQYLTSDMLLILAWLKKSIMTRQRNLKVFDCVGWVRLLEFRYLNSRISTDTVSVLDGRAVWQRENSFACFRNNSGIN